MKSKSLMGIGLLLCSAMLITACNNGWKNSDSQSSSSFVSSEISSEPEEPVVTVDGVDLTYPLAETPSNPITAEMADLAALQIAGIPNATDRVSSFFGRYLIEFFYEHNHMTTEEQVRTLGLFAYMQDTEDVYQWTIRDWGEIAYYLAYVNADNLYLTFKEMVDDRVAFAYFLSGDDNSNSDYLNADTYYLKGSDSLVASAAAEQKALMETNPGLYMGYSVIMIEKIMNIVHAENSHVLVRFIHRLARCMLRYLTVEQTGYFLKLAMTYPITKAEQDFINEETLEIINNFAKALKELDVSAESYNACYATFKEIMFLGLIDSGESNFLDICMLDYRFYDNVLHIIEDFFDDLDPKGLRNLVKFVAMLGENLNEEQYLALIGEPDPATGEVPDGELVIDLYNEQYGLLTAEEKASMEAAAASCGIDFDELVEELKEAMREQNRAVRESDDHGKTLEDVFEDYVMEHLSAKFNPGEADFYASSGIDDALVLKQGSDFDLIDLKEFLESDAIGCYYKNRNVRESSNYDNEDYGAERHFSRIVDGEISTENCGIHYLKVELSTTFRSEETKMKMLLPYVVVPASVNRIPGDVNIAFSEYGYTERYYIDDQGNEFYYAIADKKETSSLYLLKDVHYQSDSYRMDARIHLDSVYDARFNRFVGENGNYYSDYQGEGSTYISTLNTSKLGPACSVTVCTNSSSQLFGSVPVVFFYEVVEQLPPKPGAQDVTTPIK